MPASPDAVAQRMTVAISAKKAKVRPGQHEAGTAFSIRRIDAGKLVLPTGRICVTDAYSADEYPPLNRLVPPGDYPVEIVVAQLPEDLPFGNERGAFIVVAFSDAKVSAWEPVTAVAPAEPCFTDKRPHAFVQEGATGIFSPEAGAVHFAHMRQQFDQQLEVIRKQAKRFGMNDWINYRPGQDPANVIICEAGFGDGTFECFVGLTPAGRVARLVLDYDIADPATA
jgi:hypothetical protein